MLFGRIFKICKDLCSKPATSYRLLQDSLTALATELRALFQQQPRNVRNSSTLLAGMSELPSPFSSKRPDSFSSPGLNLPYSSTQFSNYSQLPPSLFPTKARCLQHLIFRTVWFPCKKCISKLWPHVSATVTKSFNTSFKVTKDLFLDADSK